jgi:hypothetical protein
MNNGQARFTYHLQQAEVLLTKAKKQKNPALWLFTNNARTPFFMLEGLAKLYADLHNKKKFTKLKEHFKLIEDGLGQIDYYDFLAKAFAANKSVPLACKQYIKQQLNSKVEYLNAILNEKEWLSTTNKRIIKINKKLNEVSWLNPKEEIKQLAIFYGEAIYKINEFVIEMNYHFDNVEEDVHELRRKLRWLSIYPQALIGCVQYEKDKKAAPHLKKYLTKDIVNSPYNRFPDAGDNTTFLLLNKNYFFSLSWIIWALGNLKDEGLVLVGLKEAIQQTTACNDDEAYKSAYAILGKKQRKMQAILDNAEVISKTFFTENNLEHLLAATASATK